MNSQRNSHEESVGAPFGTATVVGGLIANFAVFCLITGIFDRKDGVRHIALIWLLLLVYMIYRGWIVLSHTHYKRANEAEFIASKQITGSACAMLLLSICYLVLARVKNYSYFSDAASEGAALTVLSLAILDTRARIVGMAVNLLCAGLSVVGWVISIHSSNKIWCLIAAIMFTVFGSLDAAKNQPVANSERKFVIIANLLIIGTCLLIMTSLN